MTFSYLELATLEVEDIFTPVNIFPCMKFMQN